MPSIVTINVSQDNAPSPNTLQKTVAFVSEGATTNVANSLTLLTSSTSLTSMLKGALSLSGVTQVAGLATAVAAAPHNFTIGDVVQLTIAGGTGSSVGYNLTAACTITSTTNF